MAKFQSIDLLSHPLRLSILLYLSEHETATPKQVAQELGLPVENISYHFRKLKALGNIKLKKTKRVRGAVEHHYSLSRPRTIQMVDELRQLADQLESSCSEPQTVS